MPPLLRTLLTLTLLTALPPFSVAQDPHTLENGDTVDLRGTLLIKRRGWSEFLVLHTMAPYRLTPDSGDPPQDPVQELGITLSGQDDLLARSAGKAIRVTGRLQLASTSGFYWNGTLVWANTIALSNGEYLNPKIPEPGLPLAIHHYTASATLQPKLWPRLYTARDVDTHRSLSTPNLAGCRVNGAGDVLNCFCSDGFRPAKGLLHTAAGTAPATMHETFAQFMLEAPADTPITAEVECTRPAPKE